MAFLLTSYIFPLKDKIILSKHFGFYFDNPRTKEEIDTVKSFLKKNYKSEDSFKVPIKFKDKEFNEKFVTLEKLIKILRDNFYSEEENFTKLFDRYEKKSIFEFIARMWIIAKFDDKDLVVKQENHLEEGPIEKKINTLFDYCYLLSLLTHSEGDDYYGTGFLYDKYLRKSSVEPWMDFMMFCSWSYRNSLKEDSWRWRQFPCFLERIEPARSLLDNAFSSGLEEKLLYVGGSLKVANDTMEEKIRLLLLTSIIEMLLTHNPNTNRFNVEDSINKQFQLKTSILVYLNDKNRDINAIQKRLKTIYEQRSNVAHGNFNSLHKYLKNLSKKEGEEEFFDSLISDLYLYIRAILEEYLKNREFVEFLKDN